jgi:hypothetical protein
MIVGRNPSEFDGLPPRIMTNRTRGHPYGYPALANVELVP